MKARQMNAEVRKRLNEVVSEPSEVEFTDHQLFLISDATRRE